MRCTPSRRSAEPNGGAALICRIIVFEWFMGVRCVVVLSIFVFFMPNVLGDSENYIMANPMQTPAAIVPE